MASATCRRTARSFSKLTVAENLALAVRQKNPHYELVDSLFPDLVGRRNQAAGTLSGGQQQMVSFARALLNDNTILLVDEPTKGLAPKLVQEVTVALEDGITARADPPRRAESRGREEARGKGDRVSGGRVVHKGLATEIIADEALTHRLLGVGP